MNQITDLAMTRYLSDGSLDPAFGTQGNGKVLLRTAGYDRPTDAAMSFLGGFLVTARIDGHDSILAFTPDGLLDTRFSVDGIAESSVGPPSSRTVSPGERSRVATRSSPCSVDTPWAIVFQWPKA